MKNRITFFLMAIVFVAIVSCKKDNPTPTPTPAASIVGTWSDASSGGKIVFTSNEYTIYGSGLNLDKGTYTVSSSTITLKATSSLFCSLTQTCSYTFVVTATALSFTRVSDPCFQRNAYMNVSYTKQ